MKIVKNRFFLMSFVFFILLAILNSTQKANKTNLAQNIVLTPTIQISPIVAVKQEVKGTSDSAKLGVENNTERMLVTKVIDGDTIQLETGQTVRYIGIDTPETVDPRRGVQCFGKEAAARNRELVEGKRVTLEKDVSETDRFGRLLRYVYVPVEEGKSAAIFVNLQLVADGFAHASIYPPDIRYQEQFKKTEKQARQENIGLWKECGTVLSPAE